MTESDHKYWEQIAKELELVVQTFSEISEHDRPSVFVSSFMCEMKNTINRLKFRLSREKERIEMERGAPDLFGSSALGVKHGLVKH